MNDLEARIECLKVAERIRDPYDRSAEGLVKMANALYIGVIGAGAATSPVSSVKPTPAPAPTNNSKRDKVKAP